MGLFTDMATAVGVLVLGFWGLVGLAFIVVDGLVRFWAWRERRGR